MIKLEEFAVLHADALFLEQKFPLEASRKVRDRKAEQRKEKRNYAIFLEQVIEVADIPFRVIHNVTINKVSGNNRHHQL
jgi:hypothetical protein